MPYPRYVMFDIVGGIAWVSATVLGGYYLGRTVPNISSKIHYVIIIVAVVSILPAIIGVLRGRKAIESPESSSSAGK
jgi:membrane-associated protein